MVLIDQYWQTNAFINSVLLFVVPVFEYLNNIRFVINFFLFPGGYVRPR